MRSSWVSARKGRSDEGTFRDHQFRKPGSDSMRCDDIRRLGKRQIHIIYSILACSTSGLPQQKAI